MKDYLWEKKGEGDAETKELESALGAARFTGMILPQAPVRERPWRLVAVVAVGLATAAGAGFLILPRGIPVETPFVEVRTANGAPMKLYVEKWFETAVGAHAQIQVAQIGVIDLQPDSRIRVLRSDAKQQRLQLARGSLHARVSAPPRLFIVETPAVTAVDLGCEYDLGVEPGGGTRLRVRTGWVALEGQGKQSLVAAGMDCVTAAGKGPGTPLSQTSTQEFRAAISRFDAADVASLDAALPLAGAGDGVTLWHLLSRVDAAHREAVYERLNGFVPSPDPKAKVLALEKPALDAWWAAITKE